MRYTALIAAALCITGSVSAIAAGASNSENTEQTARTALSNDNVHGISLSKWDENNDGRLSKQEFRAAFHDSFLFKNWDLNSDGKLDAHELGQGMFGTWDYDDDSFVESSEGDEYWFE